MVDARASESPVQKLHYTAFVHVCRPIHRCIASGKQGLGQALCGGLSLLSDEYGGLSRHLSTPGLNWLPAQAEQGTRAMPLTAGALDAQRASMSSTLLTLFLTGVIDF